MSNKAQTLDNRINEICIEDEFGGDKIGYVYLTKGYKYKDTGEKDNQAHGFGFGGSEGKIRDKMKLVTPCECLRCRLDCD